MWEKENGDDFCIQNTGFVEERGAAFHDYLTKNRGQEALERLWHEKISKVSMEGTGVEMRYQGGDRASEILDELRVLCFARALLHGTNKKYSLVKREF